MFQYLKVKNHKGISEVCLSDLGHINIICGKNNSGKSSILEALNNYNNVGIGKVVDENCKDWLEDLFIPQAEKYSRPSLRDSKRWFSQYITEIIKEGTVWFSDEKDKIIKDIKDDTDSHLGRYRDFVNFKIILDDFFKNTVENYRTILIPPKRFLESRVEINSNQTVNPTGIGLTNRLFFLKNQDPHSTDFRNYEKINESFNNITGYEFNITVGQDNFITLYFRKGNEKWIIADSCGLGLSDILILVSFAINSDFTFIFVEEPESHIHPEMQKKFLSFIKNTKSNQFIFSTHSNVFLDPFVVDRIFYTEFIDTVRVTDETSKSEILHNLGYSVADNLVADVVVLTEGPSDIPILRTICYWLGIGDKYNIKFWPLGGDIMSDLDLSIFAERRNVLALIDADPGSKVIRTRFQKNCEKFGIKCHQLKRYSIENYFTIEALKKIFPGKIPKKLKELDPNKSVDEQIGFATKDSKKRSIKSKNHNIIKLMSLSDIENTDLYSFCLEIKEICMP